MCKPHPHTIACQEDYWIHMKSIINTKKGLGRVGGKSASAAHSVCMHSYLDVKSFEMNGASSQDLK